ncbi:MAG: SHOCT domain-containing protein [Roseburia sp.]|nr:SHOCT domain-containing protein [Roseburia sp.]
MKKKFLIHIIVPIMLAIVTDCMCLKLFCIPDPRNLSSASWITHVIAIGTSIFVLMISSSISALLYAKSSEETRKDVSNTEDIRSKIKELKSMFDEGLITEEEYNSKKQEISSR